MNIQYPAVAITLDRVNAYNETSQMNPHLRQTVTYLKTLVSQEGNSEKVSCNFSRLPSDTQDWLDFGSSFIRSEA